MYHHLTVAGNEAKVVILTGAEDAFCAGIDLNFLSVYLLKKEASKSHSR